MKGDNNRVSTITDPTITCPHCRTEIKLTESLAAPLLEATREQYEQRLSEKELEVARREAAVKEQQSAIAKAKDAIDEEVARKLKDERALIAAEEAKKAKQLLATDLESKAKELSDLQEVLKQRDEKLAEAQKAQAELIRKQRELDDAKREMDLTIEKRVEEALGAVGDLPPFSVPGVMRVRFGEWITFALHHFGCLAGAQA
jgi:hypothetical protein